MHNKNISNKMFYCWNLVMHNLRSYMTKKFNKGKRQIVMKNYRKIRIAIIINCENGKVV